MKKTALEQGQALVLVLLALAVALTVTLFVLSRSITDVAVSGSQEAAVRAFSAAEAGVERAIVTGSGGTNVTVGNGKYTTTVASYGTATDEANGLVFNTPYKFESGESATIWFVAHDVNGNITCSDVARPCFAGLGFTGVDPSILSNNDFIWVAWGDPGTLGNNATAPAVELTLFYTTTPLDYSTLKIGRVTLDPWYATPCPGGGRNCSNSFAQAVVYSPYTTQAGTRYAFGKILRPSDFGITTLGIIDQPGNLQFMRVRMLYNVPPVGVSHGVAVNVNHPKNNGSKLPSQGQFITSVGNSNDTASTGDSNRKLSVFQSWPAIPSIFENTIYSASGIVK